MAKRFYGIEMQGKFTNQKVADASALVWQASDEGRSVYDETTNSIWFADSTAWAAVSGVEAGSAMWFYQDSAPIGWTIVATIAADTALGVNSSGGTYTTGGTIEGTWTIAGHTHGVSGEVLTINQMPAHEHDHIADSQASPATFTQSIVTTGNDDQRHNAAFPTGTTGGGASHDHGGVTGSGGGTSTFRPSANVGILATKD